MDGKELRAAAELYRLHQECLSNDGHRKSPYWLSFTECWSEQRLQNADALANAYLAEHHADDYEPIDEAWLRSVGFESYGVFTDGYGGHEGGMQLGVVSLDQMRRLLVEPTKAPDTRGQLRLLLRALQIEPKGG